MVFCCRRAFSAEPKYPQQGAKGASLAEDIFSHLNPIVMIESKDFVVSMVVDVLSLSNHYLFDMPKRLAVGLFLLLTGI